MNVRRFRFALECSFKHLLGRDVFTAIQFDDAAVVKRVGITWQHAFRAQPRFRDREVRAGAGGHFGYLRILVNENAKLIASLGKPSSDKFLVSSFERSQGG